jgi:DNA-directed RNA polymerase specialized sigma24 family protein
MAAPRSLTPSSFEASLVAQAPAVTRRLRALVGDRETAEDLCQEALSRAWRVPSLQGDPERLRAWLLRTARNLAIDELRRRGRRDHVALTDDLPGAPAGGDAPAREALAALTPHQRLVLLLRFEAGLSLRELGDALAISDGARAATRSPDGLVEALEVPGRRFAVGVQWHPERDSGPASARLAEALVEAAA